MKMNWTLAIILKDQPGELLAYFSNLPLALSFNCIYYFYRSITTGNEFIHYTGQAKKIKVADSPQYLVGIVNKATKSVELVDVTVFDMEAKLKKPVYENAIDVDNVSAFNENENDYQVNVFNLKG